jgi:hypothetical protein
VKGRHHSITRVYPYRHDMCHVFKHDVIDCITYLNIGTWFLNKRLFALRVLYSYDAEIIFKFVLSVIEEFQCRDKIFAIGFDNASNYNAAMRLLTNTLKSIMNGIFFSLKMYMSYSKLNCQSGYGSRPSSGIDR